MSGICSRHQGHDPTCRLCCAIPLSKEDEAYYRGWDEHRDALTRHHWTPVENFILNMYTKLEDEARRSMEETGDTKLKEILEKIDESRRLGRGMWKRDMDELSSST